MACNTPPEVQGSKAKIVVVQAGFVFVGIVHPLQDGWLTVTDTRNVRQWGTTQGLGQLVNGPLHETVLDKQGTIRVPMQQVLFLTDVDDTAWRAVLAA